MRGKVTDAEKVTKKDRITPAYAGKSHFQCKTGSDAKDHPRLCGEKLAIQLHRFAVHGSPPPMRGKVVKLPCNCSIIGITPAYAGKSCFRNLITVDSRDPPRLCGEKDNNPILLFFKEGSPPPMRGKVAVQGDAVNHSGITPAYAGKSEKPVP